MSTTPNAREAHSDEVVFELATRLLRGATIDVTDEIGRTWQATASTLSWHDGGTRALVLEQADAFDVLSELAERLSAPASATSELPLSVERTHSASSIAR